MDKPGPDFSGGNGDPPRGVAVDEFSVSDIVLGCVDSSVRRRVENNIGRRLTHRAPDGVPVAEVAFAPRERDNSGVPGCGNLQCAAKLPCRPEDERSHG